MENRINLSSSKKNIFKETPIYIGVSVVLLILLFLSIGFAVTIGSVDISIREVYSIIINKIFNLSQNEAVSNGAIHDVVWLIRLPRIVLAIAVGIGLSVVGIVMQAIVKNPLADPYILGVSSGASLGATLAIMLGVGSVFGGNYIGIAGFIGAFLVSILVLIIANIGGRANSVKLLLAGMALSSVCSAFSSFIVYIADDAQGMQKITFWLMGSLAGAKWEQIVFILPSILFGAIFFATQSRILNLMLLGDEVAVTLGTDLHKYRHLYLIITSLMIGLLVYSSGMIGFVGLIIPHIVRMIFGTDHKKLIPVASILGAIFLIWADVLSRSIIKGTEIPIGILISIIGSPCFVWLMIRKTYGFGGKS
ncbi:MULTISPECIES: FecCD family ABC transporter permease [Romboutsia]|uniref:Hemin transport system permease protein HmuU n=1 Tax=Romboutsia hominis TaxID=1507512 RepID=A0A2P2BP07_9FIRM|nr:MULTISPECIES: iron ABC transporter permease [Romboutsia]MCH1959236.1 iron ABC transporter permease [Romboutsia hominis]MCH1970135.1 iron ABC transporter permease [Romboutsia hominis]MDB8804044.1 iron ABC transporter permease [Romboutsia sp. 1001216sp1]MDB8807222.1 iron ABC transporter permease [Romboutsia sp. 1001216sp1]MDB8809690.1 iron ABC transporter permease [Romboutsia sp. 1001216sp1]